MATMNSKGLPRSIPDVYDRLDELEEGGGISGKPEIDALTVISTPDGSDEGTTQTLANACKAKINEIIAALKA